MSFINKVKNFFYEDIEEDDEEFEAREAAKREAKLRKEEEKRRKIEQEKFEKQRRQELKAREETTEFIKPANDDLSERQLFESERTFNFPMDLGDNIFDQTDYVPIEEIQEETRKEVKEEKNLYARSNKQSTVTSTRTSYIEEKKDDTKKFHPSPVVSPVYGVLDKNYTVEDVIDKNLSKTKEFSIDKHQVDFDTVRNRAYKELDDEIEKTLTGKKDIFYNLDEEEAKEENKGTIDDYIEEEYDKDENDNEIDDVIITYEGDKDNYQEPELEETKEEQEDDFDLSPDVEISTPVKKEKKTRRSKKVEEKTEEDEEDIEEKEDLFNLIDNMYSDEEDEEEEE